MTVYTFQPGAPEHVDLPSKALELLRDPIGTVILDATKYFGGKDRPFSGVFPIQVDDEYDTVQILNPLKLGESGRRIFGLGKPENMQRAAKAESLLLKTYESGIVQPGIPKGYKAFAADIAAIGAAKLARGPSPAQPVIPIPRTDTEQNFMGGFIPPGGAAGFAQMTPASQLALAGRARRSGGGTRKRRKAAKSRKVKRTRRAKSRKRAGGKKARLVKGSAAAKRYMAKIRRKRRK